MNITLFGYPRCGKTFYGKKLSERLKLTFIDTDTLIEKRYEEKQTMGDIFRSLGEQAFRLLEREVVISLQQSEHAVIAVGGGAVLDKENVRELQKLGPLVYLDVHRDILKKRLLREKPAPAFLDRSNPALSFNEMYTRRKPLYERIPAHTITIEESTNEETLLDILHRIYREQWHGK